jgi:hypothetical protein
MAWADTTECSSIQRYQFTRGPKSCILSDGSGSSVRGWFEVDPKDTGELRRTNGRGRCVGYV